MTGDAGPPMTGADDGPCAPLGRMLGDPPADLAGRAQLLDDAAYELRQALDALDDV